MGVLDLECGLHGLVNCTNCDLSCQVALGALGCPATFFGEDIGMIVPPDFIVRQMLACGGSDTDITGNCQHGLRADFFGKSW